MEVLAVANHKGGVGKTVTAVNLAAAIAATGRRTLLVDMDAQGHATMWFVDDPGQVARDLQDVLGHGVPMEEAIQRTRVPGLDLLPATLALARLELDLVGMTRREDRLKRALAAVADRYEIVVLDMAPSLSLVSVNGLAAATGLLVPVTPTQLAVAALGTFMGWLEEFRREGVVSAALYGILVTMGDGRSRAQKDVLAALADSSWPVFKTIIPKRVAVENQVSERWTPGIPGERRGWTDVADAYRALTKEVLRIIDRGGA